MKGFQGHQGLLPFLCWVVGNYKKKSRATHLALLGNLGHRLFHLEILTPSAYQEVRLQRSPSISIFIKELEGVIELTCTEHGHGHDTVTEGKKQPDNPTLTALVFLAGTLLVVFFLGHRFMTIREWEWRWSPKNTAQWIRRLCAGPGPTICNVKWIVKRTCCTMAIQLVLPMSARSGICLVHVWSSSYILTVISQKFNAHNCPHPRNKNERTTKNTRFHIVWKHTNISFNFHMAIWLSYCQCLP